MKWAMSAVVVVWLTAVAFGEEAVAPSVASLEKQVGQLRAENYLLSQTVDRQKKEIAALREELDTIKAAISATREPMEPTEYVFIRDSKGGYQCISGPQLHFDEKATTPLKGRDLAAWKCAKDAAEKTKEFFEPTKPTRASMVKCNPVYIFQFGQKFGFDSKERRYRVPHRVYITDERGKFRLHHLELQVADTWHVFAGFPPSDVKDEVPTDD